MQAPLAAAVAYFLLAATVAVAAEDLPGVKVTHVGSQSSAKAPPENFTGSVRLDSMFRAASTGRVSGGVVTFEPGARTAWHTHPLGQTLIVTSGAGVVQQWGGPQMDIRPGDVVWIAPGVKHWHGASSTVAMSHIAISEALDGKTVEWMEKVSDDQYLTPTRHHPTP